MTEDRVPRCSCGHPRDGHLINGYGPCRSEDGCPVFRAMTEDRVPTLPLQQALDEYRAAVRIFREVKTGRYLEDAREVLDAASERLDAALAAQPAPPHKDCNCVNCEGTPFDPPPWKRRASAQPAPPLDLLRRWLTDYEDGLTEAESEQLVADTREWLVKHD